MAGVALSQDEFTTYTTVIDEILNAADLETVSAKRIRESLQSKLEKDLTPQKQAIDDLAMQRFNIAQATKLSIKGPSPETLEAERLFRKYGNRRNQAAAIAVEAAPDFISKPSKDSSRAFNCLPQEVFTLFVEHSVCETSTHWLCKTESPKLKALRLSCVQFAYNPRLMEILFRGIRLVAVLQHLELLEKADIRKIAPYVQRLTFFPPFHSWNLSFDGFKEIVVSQAVLRYCKDHEIWTGGDSFAYENDGYTKFIKHYWNERLPFTNDELAEGYKRYVDLANTGKDLLESHRLKDQWKKALKALSKCQQLRVDSQKYTGNANDVPKEVDCNVYKHYHDPQHREDICREAAGALGDKAF